MNGYNEQIYAKRHGKTKILLSDKVFFTLTDSNKSSYF